MRIIIINNYFYYKYAACGNAPSKQSWIESGNVQIWEDL